MLARMVRKTHSIESAAKQLTDLFRTVFDFLNISRDEFEAQLALEAEFRELALRDLPGLTHKRAKHDLGNRTARSLWYEELEAFASCTLRRRMPSDCKLAGRSDALLARMLDALIAEEQSTAALRAVPVPVTRSFESSWAQ
jgi:hypothetical protein